METYKYFYIDIEFQFMSMYINYSLYINIKL